MPKIAKRKTELWNLGYPQKMGYPLLGYPYIRASLHKNEINYCSEKINIAFMKILYLPIMGKT